MADRVNVNLTIRKEDQIIFEALCDDFNGKFEGETFPNEVATIEYSFHEVNDAELEIEQLLQEKIIPYDKTWEQGRGYNAGTKYHRIDSNGNSIIKLIDKNMEGMVTLEDVEKAVEQACIHKFIKEKRNAFHIISWKDQGSILSARNQ